MMQFLIYLTSCLLALASADGYYYEAPAIPLATPLIVRTGNAAALLQPQPLSQQYQYHTQDTLGQYAYGYSEPLSSKQESRTLDGITRGSYAYVDANGKLQTVAYTADAGGFRVAATNLPQQPQLQLAPSLQPVQDTAEVLAARAQHLAAHQQAKLRFLEASTASTRLASGERKSVEHIPDPPQAVQDTPEVAAAKAEFFKRFEEVKQRNEKLQQKQKKQDFDLGYSLVKSRPIEVTLPLGGYKVESNGFQYGYNVLVPSLRGGYLPVV